MLQDPGPFLSSFSCSLAPPGCHQGKGITPLLLACLQIGVGKFEVRHSFWGWDYYLHDGVLVFQIILFEYHFLSYLLISSYLDSSSTVWSSIGSCFFPRVHCSWTWFIAWFYWISSAYSSRSNAHPPPLSASGGGSAQITSTGLHALFLPLPFLSRCGNSSTSVSPEFLLHPLWFLYILLMSLESVLCI